MTARSRGRGSAAGRPGKGALFAIALLLFASGLIRLASGAGTAWANAAAAEVDTTLSHGATCEQDAGALAMLADLQAREKRLAEREGLAEDHAQALALARAEIDARMAALVAAEEKLSATLAIADQAADKDVQRLVAVYERMKPKDAAKLFGEMEPDFAAGFLGRMRPEVSAAIMAGLEPKAAYTISVMLAGRNASAPRN